MKSNNYIVKEDMICPVTKIHCDDECCTVASICNVSGGDKISPEPTRITGEDYVLLKNIDWFGKVIPAGTIYKQVNADYFQPFVNYARCPSFQIDFYTVRNNPEYFLKISR